MKKFYIYKITNEKTKRVYIGSTSNNPLERWRSHESGMRKKTHVIVQMVDDYQKYGVDSFIFEILKTLDSRDEMLKQEMKLIKQYVGIGLCYNSSGNTSTYRRSNSDEYWERRIASKKKYNLSDLLKLDWKGKKS